MTNATKSVAKMTDDWLTSHFSQMFQDNAPNHRASDQESHECKPALRCHTVAVRLIKPSQKILHRFKPAKSEERKRDGKQGTRRAICESLVRIDRTSLLQLIRKGEKLIADDDLSVSVHKRRIHVQ